RVGIGIGKEKGGIRYYGDVGYKRIMKGEEVKIKGELRGVEIEGEIEGIKEGKDRIAIGAGVGIDLGKDIGINVNINYEGARKYKEMYGNIGISWGF
ncbi:MAG: hypothetical protein LBU29_01525, partial [Endomicrobium sp.]|nr:hypothetical protein [Endomicrobium sp.]